MCKLNKEKSPKNLKNSSSSKNLNSSQNEKPLSLDKKLAQIKHCYTSKQIPCNAKLFVKNPEYTRDRINSSYQTKRVPLNIDTGDIIDKIKSRSITPKYQSPGTLPPHSGKVSKPTISESITTKNSKIPSRNSSRPISPYFRSTNPTTPLNEPADNRSPGSKPPSNSGHGTQKRDSSVKNHGKERSASQKRGAQSAQGNQPNMVAK